MNLSIGLLVTLVAAATWTPTDAAGTVCPKGTTHMIALRCGEGGEVKLLCAPSIEEPDPYSLDSDLFAHSVCRGPGKPILIPEISGCLPNDNPAFWSLLELEQPERAFCRSFPATISENALRNFVDGEDFEDDILPPIWAIDIIDDVPIEEASFITCEDINPDFGAVGGAAEGMCAQRTKAGCSDGVGRENFFAVGFFVFNDSFGTKNFELSFATAWDNQEGGDCTRDDTGEVLINVDGTIIDRVVYSVCNDPSSVAWDTKVVPLAPAPMTFITVQLTVVVGNAVDCDNDSAVLLDDVQIVELP